MLAQPSILPFSNMVEWRRPISTYLASANSAALSEVAVARSLFSSFPSAVRVLQLTISRETSNRESRVLMVKWFSGEEIKGQDAWIERINQLSGTVTQRYLFIYRLSAVIGSVGQ
jgi:hypothetical protein